MNLTEDQRRNINLFIAEKRGWIGFVEGVSTYVGYPPGGIDLEPIPDYTRSLDSCHEVEIHLGWHAIELSHIVYKQYDQYISKIRHFRGNDGREHCATAEQRALALFETLGGVL